MTRDGVLERGETHETHGRNAHYLLRTDRNDSDSLGSTPSLSSSARKLIFGGGSTF
jgi:hypothetical protein